MNRSFLLDVFLSHLVKSVFLEAKAIKISVFLSWPLGQVSPLLIRKQNFGTVNVIYQRHQIWRSS